MHPLDSADTTFITLTRRYCYNVMPFGLKNVGAIYKRMMSRIFEPLLGQTIEAYIDDMLVKSKSRDDHLSHLRDVFWLMRLHILRLNPDKCAFGVESGHFLGFLVSQRGIKMAPDQVKSIAQIQPPITKKRIQTLIGKLTTLNRFISRYSNRLRPFFTALKGASSKGWGPEYNRAFHFIKEYIAFPLSLSHPVDGEELFIYLATSASAMSATLVRSDEDDKQNSIYFVSKVLIDAKTRYTDFEQIALSLRVASKKLCSYFQAHTIVVLTSYLIKVFLHKPDASGQLLKWAMELSEFDIKYCLRLTIKG